MDDINTYLHAGWGVNLALATDALPGHAVTVWGYDYDEGGNYLGIHITDSDDSEDSGSPPDLLPYSSVTYDDTNDRWNLGGAYSDYYITEVHALGRYPQPVPEPGTMILMGIGFSGLWGARRRKLRRQ